MQVEETLGSGRLLPLKTAAQGHHAYRQVQDITFKFLHHLPPFARVPSRTHTRQILGSEADQPQRVFAISGKPGICRHQPERLRVRQELFHDKSPVCILSPGSEVEREQQLDLIAHLERTP